MPDCSIVWVDPQTPEEVEFARGHLPAHGFRISAPRSGDRTELEELVREADVLLTQGTAVDIRLLSLAPRVKLIQKYGGREDGIDLQAAGEAGSMVALMPLRGCTAVAELAMTLILALSKQLVQAHQATANGAYRDLGLTPTETNQRAFAFQWMKLPHLLEIYGTTLGIIGFGEIGTEISQRARSFGMHVLYTKHTRLNPSLEQRLQVEWAEVDDILSGSDFVVLSTPHTPETQGMIGARELGLMRPGAYLVNIARGGLVDEAALVQALRDKRIAGAGLDVYVEEPVPADNPLLSLSNVICTPHIGGGTGGARVKQMTDVLDNIVRFVQGEPPLHVVADVPAHT